MRIYGGDFKQCYEIVTWYPVPTPIFPPLLGNHSQKLIKLKPTKLKLMYNKIVGFIE